MVTPEPPEPPEAPAVLTPAARVLLRHRDRIAALLSRADAEPDGGSESESLKRAVSLLVDEVADDLVRLYALAERGALTRGDLLVVLPALERLRNALRFWQHRRRSLRDTLHKAMGALAPSAS